MRYPHSLLQFCKTFHLALLLDPAASNSFNLCGYEGVLDSARTWSERELVLSLEMLQIGESALNPKGGLFNLHLDMVWQFLWRADKLAVSHAALALACHDSQDASTYLQLSRWKKNRLWAVQHHLHSWRVGTVPGLLLTMVSWSSSSKRSPYGVSGSTHIREITLDFALRVHREHHIHHQKKAA